MCDAMSPPGPGDPLYMVWKPEQHDGKPAPEVGAEIESGWSGHPLLCCVEQSLDSSIDPTWRRLSLLVIG